MTDEFSAERGSGMNAYEGDGGAAREAGPGASPAYAPPPSPESGARQASGTEGPVGPGGLAALALPYRVVGALALATAAVLALVHLGMVFLHVAPPNTVSKQHAKTIGAWIYPEFEQNWKLFAPNPLQQNVSVQARAEGRRPDGSSFRTGWYDLSARDGAAIEGNPVPSHTQQNELRRAWDFYASSHDVRERPNGLRGELSARYLLRLGVLRLERAGAGGRDAVVERVRLRARTTPVPLPKWGTDTSVVRPAVRELPWWDVSVADRPGGGPAPSPLPSYPAPGTPR
ncbi:DUF5819 family protein [Streptomyces sp. NPDC007088]|uniref:DUF5819 family protein n=1 Tax=Streptomyces sp. NPDC007088 TaxID=3364773 RepID=UPI0036C823E7